MQVSIYKHKQRRIPNMDSALIFTAYELIICVTPRWTGSELALSGKKQ